MDASDPKSRRTILGMCAGLVLRGTTGRGSGSRRPAGGNGGEWQAAARTHLESVMPSSEHVERFLTPARPGEFSSNGRFTFDADLGLKPERSFRDNGVKGSKWFADYEADGARRCVNHAGSPCRIHTYGDSFTHGLEVNDGKTWQEYLAAHIRELVRNFGVGGFSVYQAYRRMRLVETTSPA